MCFSINYWKKLFRHMKLCTFGFFGQSRQFTNFIFWGFRLCTLVPRARDPYTHATRSVSLYAIPCTWYVLYVRTCWICIPSAFKWHTVLLVSKLGRPSTNERFNIDTPWCYTSSLVQLFWNHMHCNAQKPRNAVQTETMPNARTHERPIFAAFPDQMTLEAIRERRRRERRKFGPFLLKNDPKIPKIQ